MLTIYSNSTQANRTGHIKREQPCDLCRSERVQLVAGRDRRGNDLPTVVCVRCGLVSHLRIPSDAELEAFYARQYRRQYHGEVTPSAHRVVRAWKTGRQIYRLLDKYIGQNDRLLEVGAGIGCTVKIFQRAGLDASGIEPGEAFQAFARDQLQARVYKASLCDLPPVASYDFVLLVHVLEHFNQPGRALRQIHRLLRPGGRLYVECPNLGAPHAAPKKLFHFAHVHNFTHQTLFMLARSCGFEPLEWLSDESQANLRMVLARNDLPRLHMEPDSYRNTMAALTRYNTLTYHLRRRYLLERGRRLAGLYSDYLLAKRRMRRIIELCREPDPASCAPGPAMRRSA